ncbi:hypothetical protein J6590_074648 [Homalodisca vitripennis]|nr:hypothetical protein J6590_074648 [Homalodisca vitripennis]
MRVVRCPWVDVGDTFTPPTFIGMAGVGRVVLGALTGHRVCRMGGEVTAVVWANGLTSLTTLTAKSPFVPQSERPLRLCSTEGPVATFLTHFDFFCYSPSR